MKKYKNLINNFFSLYVLQITNIIIPLITLPYLVRVLGVEKFGLVSFSQTFATFFIVLVDFGFDLSIVRLISIHSEFKNKISEIVSSVLIIKIILISISFVVYYIIISNVQKFDNNFLLFLLMFGIIIGQGLFPTWLFQGMQKMFYITILNVGVKLFFLALIFLLINSSKDYLYYPILLSLGYIGILPFAYYLAIKNFNIKFYIPKYLKILYYFKYSSHFFVSRIAVRLYEGGGLFIVGLISSDLVTGYYAIADKLRGAITSLYSPISKVLYPYIAKEKNITLYKKMFLFINLINIVGLLILFIYTESILNIIFGTYSETTVLLLRIFVFVMLLDVPSILLGYPLLGALGHTNFVNYSLVVTAIIYISVILILYLFDILTPLLVAIIYVVTIFIEVMLRVYGVTYKYKIFKKDRYV